MATAFAEYDNVFPVLAPVDTGTGPETFTNWVDLKTAQEVSFMVYFGAITTATAADLMTVTVESSTTGDSSSETAIAFNYRLSGATGANTWGAITAAAATGCEIASTDDGKMLFITIDPAKVAETANKRWVRVVLTQTGLAACLVSVVAMIKPRYAQTTMTSAST